MRYVIHVTLLSPSCDCATPLNLPLTNQEVKYISLPLFSIPLAFPSPLSGTLSPAILSAKSSLPSLARYYTVNPNLEGNDLSLSLSLRDRPSVAAVDFLTFFQIKTYCIMAPVWGVTLQGTLKWIRVEIFRRVRGTIFWRNFARFSQIPRSVRPLNGGPLHKCGKKPLHSPLNTVSCCSELACW